MSVISFPARSHIEIDGGIVHSSTISDEKGTRPDLTHIGKFHYFVDVVEPNGERI